MTLDVTIGKLEINYENLNMKDIEEYNEPVSLNILHTMTVNACPEADHDVCNPDRTIYPRKSKRSGSTGFWRFWRVLDEDLYKMFRSNPNTNDKDYAYLKPVIERIKDLDESDFDKEKMRENVKKDKQRDERLDSNLYDIQDVEEEVEERLVGHKSRLKWFKYWSEKAVKNYDEKAAIRFW